MAHLFKKEVELGLMSFICGVVAPHVELAANRDSFKEVRRRRRRRRCRSFFNQEKH